MADEHDELLAAACAHIRENPHPAYVKGSDLRCLAVNEAYKALFGGDPSEGFEGAEDEDIAEREKRCLIFGAAARFRYVHPEGGCFDISFRRDRLAGGHAVLIAVFMPIAEPAGEIGLYRALLDALPVASFVRDEAQRLVFANRAYRDLMRVNTADILGRTTREMHGGMGAVLHGHNQRALESGEMLEAEISFERPDGSTVPTVARICGVTTLDGKRYLMGSVTDTTVLRSRESQLMEAQRQAEAVQSDLRSVVESLPVGIVVVDAAGRIEHVNDAFEALWQGVSPPVAGQSFADLLRFQSEREPKAGGSGPLSGPETARERLETIRAGRMATCEVAYADGRVLIEAGRPISGDRCLLTYIDITESRQREREVLEARSALADVGSLVKDAVSSMSQGLLIVEGREVVLSNPALLEMIAMSPALLAPGNDVGAILDYCAACGVPAGRQDEGPVDASQFPARVLAGESLSLTLRSAAGRWIRLDATSTGYDRSVLVFTDITDLKSREEELRRLVERAETADRVKSEFLANMSHEIRTPMNGVLGMAELLAKSDLDTRQKTFIDIMVKSGNSLLTIINDILDFSRIDAGQMTLRDMPFNPVEAVEDVATLLSAKAAEKNVALVVRGAGNMPQSVVGDAGRFRQIVTNLVGNAVKFTDRGHVLIDMEARPGTVRDIEIVLRVEDTGVGIAADKMTAIFEKFSQIDTSSTRRHEGTGLGLAITDGLVRLFSGTLSAESTVGKGSVFTVRLPMTQSASVFPVRPLPADLSGARVLIVDAHPVSRQAICEMLTGWGFDATAVGSAAEAFAVAAAVEDMGVSVDAVVLDQAVPEAGEIVRTLRTLPWAAHLAIVGLAAIGGGEDDALLCAQHIEAHLMKPVRAALLRETLCDVVREMRMHAAPARPGTVLPLRPAPVVAASADGLLDVLVAEDNEVNGILFTQLLHLAGLRFCLVGNGAEAVAAFRESAPRMILMDVSMPVMNGLEASRKIRDIEGESAQPAGKRRVPIVAVTAHVLEDDRDACLAAGMDDILTKPISADRLEEMLERWLSGHGPVPAQGSLR